MSTKEQTCEDEQSKENIRKESCEAKNRKENGR